MDPVVRVAVAGDEGTLAALNGVVQELHVASRPDQFKPTRIEEVREWYRQMLQNAAARVWIAEVDGEPVGYVLAIICERREGPFCPARKWCDLDQIAVV